MRIPECLTVLLLLIAAQACGDVPDRQASSEALGNEEPFAEYARDLFAELRRESLDSTLETEVGLFGDLSVASGERAVMRQYRYRVDSSDSGSLAHMAFHVRDASEQYAPVPVVLTFAARDNAWRLEQAVFGDAVSEMERDHGGHHDSEERSAMQTQTPLYRSLRAHFDAWLGAAISRADTASGD